MSVAKHTWRLLDTGIQPAANNIALNRVLLESRQTNASPNTLRFLGFEPCALLGFHQSAAQELNLAYCAEHGITIQRRITGGGAIYFDTTQIGWELYLDKQTVGTADMTAISRRICTAVAHGISSLGVTAEFRPRNDIEVDGRKVSGTGGAFDGDALLYQGTLLISFDIERMLRILNIPAEKLSDKAISSARERVTNLETLLGYVPERDVVVAALQSAIAEEFNVDFVAGELNDVECALYDDAIKEIDDPEWVALIDLPASDRPTLTAAHKFPAGLFRVNVAYDQVMLRIKQVWFSGDVFVSPRRTLIDLEAALRDTHIDNVETIILNFFAQRSVDMLTLTPENILGLIKMAIEPAEVVA